MSTKIILKDVRCSYLYVNNMNKHNKYGAQVLLPKGDPQIELIQAAVNKELIAQFGADSSAKKGKYKLPFRDGDDEQDGEEYTSMMFFNANNNRKPGIVNRKGQPPTDDELEELCYSGAYFHVSVDFYPFKSQDGSKPGIAASLNNIMLRKAGVRLDGSVSASSEFAEFSVEDDDFDDLDDL
jgi:hypothetical protein